MFNANERKSQSGVEKMVKSGKTTSAVTFQRIADLAASYASVADMYREGGQELVKLLIAEKVIGPNDAAGMLDGDKLSPSGQEFVEGLIIGYLFNGNDNTVRMLTAEGMGNVRKAVINSLSALIVNRTLGEYSLQQEIEQAIELCYRAHRDYGGNVKGLLRQRNLFNDGSYSENSTELAGEIAIAINSGSSTLRDGLDVYNRSYADESGQADGLFGKRSREEALQIITNYIRNKNNGQQDSGKETGDVEVSGQGGQRDEAGGSNQGGPADTGGAAGSDQGGADRTGQQENQGAGGKRQVKSSIRGLEGYTEDEIKDAVIGRIGEVLGEMPDNFLVRDIRIIGSRTTGTAREDSDLDVLVEYEGDISEDDLFNMLNAEPLVIDGIRVDINPITPAKSGTIDEFLERNADYKKEDKQGNPIDNNGNLILTEVESVDIITDEDFLNPTRNIKLPKIPEKVDNLIGAKGKPVVIKKNVFEKNKNKHKDLTPEDSRTILREALYQNNGYGQTQPITRPNYWVILRTSDPNRVVILEVSNNKDNVEIVGWRYAGEVQIEQLKNQAEREGGQLLIQTSDEAAAGLSTLPSVDSESKDTQSSESPNENGENNELTDAQVKALAFVTGKSEEEIRAQQGSLPYNAKGEKTLHHPATLRAAYESGNTADIARAEKSVGDYIMSSDSIEKLDSTAKEFAASKKQAEKGSAEYRMDDFCEKKCRERIKEIKRETAEVKEPTERIDDVGEKIGGARKDLAQNMSDKIDLDADIRFRVANENQAIFVSNAAKAVGSIKQDKATPDQWLAMIQKQGGIKAGEDKWLGLSDWLKASDKKSLTKQEVLDYINQNKIQIEEQRYSGR